MRLLDSAADGFFIAPAVSLGIHGRSVAGGGREAGWWATENNAPDNGDGPEMTAADSPVTLLSPEGGRGVAWLQPANNSSRNAAEGQMSNLPEFPDSS